MKKAFLAAAAVLLLASFVYAQDASLDVHDFAVTYSGQTTATRQGCRGCHIPHGGSIIDATNPGRTTVFGSGVADYTTGTYKLWDKNLSTGAYQTYSSDNVTGGMLMAPGTSTDVAWHSYLCFSCHDGTVATLNLPTGTIESYDFLMNGGNGDTDLTNDHPVDIDWPIGNTVDYETALNVTGGNTGFPSVQAMPLYGGTSKVECSTCHNPHKQPTAVAGGTRPNFLRMNSVTDNTSLCRACHLSKR